MFAADYSFLRKKGGRRLGAGELENNVSHYTIIPYSRN